MIRIEGEKKTPTQFAKETVLDRGAGAFYWYEQIDADDLEAMTAREKDSIGTAIQRQYDRVQRFLGL